MTLLVNTVSKKEWFGLPLSDKHYVNEVTLRKDKIP